MHVFTIGVEEEYQIIDAETRDLVSHVSKIIEGHGDDERLMSSHDRSYLKSDE